MLLDRLRMGSESTTTDESEDWPAADPPAPAVPAAAPDWDGEAIVDAEDVDDSIEDWVILKYTLSRMQIGLLPQLKNKQKLKRILV